MHVAFIRYLEDLWYKSYKTMVYNWHRALAVIEPTFIKIVHYTEPIVLKAGKEFVGEFNFI